MTNALIMAGGRSERMRATSGPLHKALVPVLGVPLLDRNLLALLDAGFRRIILAIGADETSIEEHFENRSKSFAAEEGCRLNLLRERRPLGTIGAARQAIEDANALLVVNVDNLTSMSLRDLVAFHEKSQSALTIATHEESFQLPYGELELDGERIRRCLEKPIKRFWISSGTYVLSPAACALVPEDCRFDAPQLVSALIDSRQPVAAFRHTAPWIDVNDHESIRRAERLIEAHPLEFQNQSHATQRR